MQKKLIALAIAGFASTAAFAQSNVTIYGVMDASVDVVKNGDTAAGSSQRATKISSNASRIGFKGTEDLGDGLKAVFQIETAVDVDGSAVNTLATRNTYVGLASDSWGQIIAGRYDTPYKTATRSWDLFADHLADNRNLLGRSRASGIAFDQRPTSTVRYDSPNLSGFKFAAAYIAGAETALTTGQNKGSAWSVNGSYDVNTEWSLVAAYERHKFGDVGTGTVVASGAVAGTDILSGETEKAWKVGAAYKAGPLRASVIYEKVKDDFSAASKTGDHKAWTASGGYTFGSNEFKVAYTKVDEYENISDSGAKQWAVGIDHILSKRTKIYGEYVRLSNESAGAYGLTGAGVNTTGGTAARGADADPSAWQFGIKHSF
jgi:predicted porin